MMRVSNTLFLEILSSLKTICVCCFIITYVEVMYDKVELTHELENYNTWVQ